MKADRIIKNAKIFTADMDRPMASALAVKDGKFVYVGDEAVNLDAIRYEQSDDKDLIYTVVSKSVKKDLGNIRYRDMGDL